MSRLIIDGKSVFEIDEECYKKKKFGKDCDVEKYMNIDNIGFDGRKSIVQKEDDKEKNK